MKNLQDFCQGLKGRMENEIFVGFYQSTFVHIEDEFSQGVHW